MEFPVTRLRRLRRSAGIRAMVRETVVTPDCLVLPLFVVPGRGLRTPIDAMPGCFHTSPDLTLEDAKAAAGVGVPSVLLFGLPEHKDGSGSEACSPDGPVQEAVRLIKGALPDLVVMTDVCLCAYTSHGHCGILVDGPDVVDNDATLDVLARMALSHARAGADVVAPSDMMDGRVAAIRRTLDAEGFTGTAILSYAAKYASAFYGPFREAADSAPQHGDRSGYQMDPANGREALREVALDVAEGADMVMVKPALAYLDIIRRVRESTPVPVAAYSVSGEYSMIKAAAARGWLDEERAARELLTSIRRAGAEIIITYFARDAAVWFGPRGS